MVTYNGAMGRGASAKAFAKFMPRTVMSSLAATSQKVQAPGCWRELADVCLRVTHPFWGKDCHHRCIKLCEHHQLCKYIPKSKEEDLNQVEEAVVHQTCLVHDIGWVACIHSASSQANWRTKWVYVEWISVVVHQPEISLIGCLRVTAFIQYWDM